MQAGPSSSDNKQDKPATPVVSDNVKEPNVEFQVFKSVNVCSE